MFTITTERKDVTSSRPERVVVRSAYARRGAYERWDPVSDDRTNHFNAARAHIGYRTVPIPDHLRDPNISWRRSRSVPRGHLLASAPLEGNRLKWVHMIDDEVNEGE